MTPYKHCNFTGTVLWYYHRAWVTCAATTGATGTYYSYYSTNSGRYYSYYSTNSGGQWLGTFWAVLHQVVPLLRHIIPLEEFDRNCLQLSYALFFRSIHISLTFSERDVGTALSYSDKNHFEESISRKTYFKSSIWKWQRRHLRKLLEVARFSVRDVTMAKIIGTTKLPSSPPPNLRSGSIFVSLRKLHSGGQGETKR